MPMSGLTPNCENQHFEIGERQPSPSAGGWFCRHDTAS
jgi:hypothetical protein